MSLVFPRMLSSRFLIASVAGALACARPADAPAVAQSSSTRWCDLLPRPEFNGLERVTVGSDWFEVYRVDAGVFAIAEPSQYQEVISYLIIGGERALLFDTGLGLVPIRPIVAQLTPLPVTVLNSHTHYDHVGGNAEFEAILAMDTEYTRANTWGFPHEQLTGEVAPEAFCRRPAGFDAAAFRTKPYRPSAYIADGYRLDLGGRILEVLHVPGHTPDAIAVLDSAAGLLWTGDSFYEAPIWLYVPETDLDAYVASIDRLVGLAPRVRKLFGAHNVAQSDPTRLRQLKEALAQVRGGKVSGVDKGNGQLEFPFDGFSILTAPQVLEGKRGDRSLGGSGLSSWLDLDRR